VHVGLHDVFQSRCIVSCVDVGVSSAVEVEPGHSGQHNASVADVHPGSVVDQESDAAAASRHRGHAQTLRQQEGR